MNGKAGKMNNDHLSAREIQESDVDHIVNYWYKADPDFLVNMGVDLSKMPAENDLRNYLEEPLSKPYEQKQTYCIIWLLDDNPVGHSNVNKIKFGQEAHMHLHLWTRNARQKGFGTAFVKMTLPYFFKNLKLKNLFCEPYALNPAPNHTLIKVGFDFIKNYITTPGFINFEQPVNRYEMSFEKFEVLGLNTP